MFAKHFIKTGVTMIMTAAFASMFAGCGGKASAPSPNSTTDIGATAPTAHTTPESKRTTSAPVASAANQGDELDRVIMEASDYLNDKIPHGSKVVFVSARKNLPALSEYIVEGLTENAVNDKAFTVVDRAQLDAIRTELSFQMSGEVDDSTARSIGRILGAKTIVTVVVSQIGNMYRFGARALDVESAEIQGLINRNIQSGPTIDALASAQPAHTPVIPAQAATATAQTPASQPTQPVASGQVSQQTQGATTDQPAIQPKQTTTVKTVKIGDRRWMAENLNIKTPDSWCYDNNDSYCSRYGRLYTWEAAKKACDGIGDGWRLPTRVDLEELLKDVGGEKTAGTKLKAATGWRPHSRHPFTPGTDDFGFSALPGGYGSGNKFSFAGEVGYWWRAERVGRDATSLQIYNSGESVGLKYGSLTGVQNGLSVRCVKDEL